MLPGVEVPLFANRETLSRVAPEVAERLRLVINSGRYILGEEVASFEAEFARYLRVEHCVGMNSGTDALTIGLRALGVQPGTEVVVPAVTFFATAEAVLNVGAVPVFAEVEAGSWCITAESVEPALSEMTAAIVPVHLFGNPAPMHELTELARDRGLRLLEDAAQASGARLDGAMIGGFGDAAAFSFYPAKNLGAMGDGGALVTNDDEVAALARRLREHGSDDGRIHTEVGYNSRLDEIQAAALRIGLRRLDEWTLARREAASTYRSAGLAELVELPTETPSAESCYHLFIVATPERDRLHRRLAEMGVGSRPYFTPPLCDQPALHRFAPDQPLEQAGRYGVENLALPMGPDLTQNDILHVVESVRAALA